MKASLSDLAILGGPPAFRDPLYVGRPNIGDRERLRQRVEDLLERRWLTNGGPYVREFEARIAALAGVRQCVALCNGTVALEIVIRALGLSGEVIVPSFTFVATAHALQWQGITPVFCDIDPATCTIDSRRIESLVTPRTTGIVGVHLWGRACNVAALADIAGRLKLKLVFDAAHAFGCGYGGRMVGGFGDAEVFSFHATKFLNSFEGGAVVTNDEELARRVRLMANFGFADYDEVVCLGTNGKMTEVAAAMGITSLESMDRFIEVNRRHEERYRLELGDVPGVTLRQRGPERTNHQYVVAEIGQELAGISRDQLQRVLVAENVLARRYFHPGCHRMEPYRSSFPDAGRLLPETERMTARVLSLPTGTAIGGGEIATICHIIRFAVAHSAELARTMGAADSRTSRSGD